MLVKNRLVLIVLTIYFSVCGLNTAIHSACDSWDDCNRRIGNTDRANGVRCEIDEDNDEGDCYKQVGGFPHVENFLPNPCSFWEQDADCPKASDGSDQGGDDSSPGDQDPIDDSSSEDPSPTTGYTNALDTIQTEVSTEPERDSEENTDSPDNTLGIGPLPPEPIPQLVRTTSQNQYIPEPVEEPVAEENIPEPEPEPEEPRINPNAPDENTAKAEDIFITEIMVDTLGDTHPQWIELTNYSDNEVNLKGWKLRVHNKLDDDAYPKYKAV